MNATPRGGEVEAIWRRDGSGAQSPPPAGAGGHPGLQPTRDRRIHADPSSEPQPATAGQPAPPREFPVPTAQARHPAGLTGSSSSDLRMIFIPSPHTCPLLSKEALTAARGPLNLTALGRRTGRSEGVTKPQQWKCYLGLHDDVQDRPDRPLGGPPFKRQTCRRRGKRRDQDALTRGAPWAGGP